MTTYTTADLATLDRAIASGSLEVQMGDRRLRYRSMDELMAARAHVAAQLAAASGRRANRVGRFTFTTARGD